MAQIIQETLTVADSKNKTIGVASALGNALAAMSGSTAESVANQTVQALNDLATDVSCSSAASSAASKWLPCYGHCSLVQLHLKPLANVHRGVGMLCGQLNSSSRSAGLTAGSPASEDTAQQALLLLLRWCGLVLTLAHAHCRCCGPAACSPVLFHQACESGVGRVLPQQRGQARQCVLGAAAQALDVIQGIQLAPSLIALHEAHASSVDRQCLSHHSVSVQV